MKIRGYELALHENENLSDAIRRNEDFWEADILDYLSEHYHVQGTIVDAGANIGNHALYFANELDVDEIICFEPQIDNYILLLENLRQYRTYVSCRYQALSDKKGWIKFQTNKENMGASQVVFNEEDEGILVPCTTLDSLELNNVTLLKLDVEWHEPWVLRGASATIQRCKPRILIEDTENQYGILLPDYEIVMSWPDYNTYLYEWKK